jgi:hypothetical protein
MSEFETDLQGVLADLDNARSGLIAVVEALGFDDMGRGRRGGWTVRDILLHVIGGENHYTDGIRSLRNKPGGRSTQSTPVVIESSHDAVRMLEESRSALLTEIEGIDEDTFYTLKRLLNEEGHGQTYSVLSVLENIARHDREHASQVREILATESTRS